MNSGTPTEVVIPLRKSKVVLVIFGAVVFVAINIWIWSIANSQTRYNPLYMKAVAVASGSFFGLCALYGCFKIFDARPGLIIDDLGIVDNSSAGAVGRILWDEIVALNVSVVARKRFVTVVVADPKKFVRRDNFVSRTINAANTKMTGSPINISSSSLALNFDGLVQVLTAAFEKHKGRGAPAIAPDRGGFS